jgi:hypothetical protein
MAIPLLKRLLPNCGFVLPPHKQDELFLCASCPLSNRGSYPLIAALASNWLIQNFLAEIHSFVNYAYPANGLIRTICNSVSTCLWKGREQTQPLAHPETSKRLINEKQLALSRTQNTNPAEKTRRFCAFLHFDRKPIQTGVNRCNWVSLTPAKTTGKTQFDAMNNKSNGNPGKK